MLQHRTAKWNSDTVSMSRLIFSNNAGIGGFIKAVRKIDSQHFRNTRKTGKVKCSYADLIEGRIQKFK